MTFKIVLVSLLLSPLGVSGQIMKALEKRYLEPFRWIDYEQPMTGNEKVGRLSILPKGDTLQFINYYDEELYPLDTAGLHYLGISGEQVISTHSRFSRNSCCNNDHI